MCASRLFNLFVLVWAVAFRTGSGAVAASTRATSSVFTGPGQIRLGTRPQPHCFQGESGWKKIRDRGGGGEFVLLLRGPGPWRGPVLPRLLDHTGVSVDGRRTGLPFKISS